MKEFKNKVAAITGSATGIGRAFAEEAAKRGMRLALIDINTEGLEETKAICEKAGAPKVVTIKTDVTKYEEVRFSIHGGIHLAGQGGSQAFQLIVQGIGLAVGAHSTAKVLFAHSDRTGQQVAQVVGQVGIDAVDQGFIGESTIVAERNFA